MQRYSQKEILAYCIKNKISFCITRQPGDKADVLMIGENIYTFDKRELADFVQRDGFIIAPFSFENNQAVFIENTFTVEESVDSEVYNQIENIQGRDEISSPTNFYSDYNSYSEQFKNLYSQIKQGAIQKAILSRVKHIDSILEQNAAEYYYRLSLMYSNACLFMYYTPISGMWLGATPELLLKIKNDNVHTVSLAGTRKYEDNHLSWNKKEIDEQQFVSDYMESLFDRYNINDYQVEGPLEVKAGKISHLKTTYNFHVSNIKSSISDFILDLHPTPAVCGLPKNSSMDVIYNVEKHDRTYYSGFIGRVNKDELSLYVNIRSMKFVNSGVDIYLGGGITEDSDSEKEWHETELKAGTLLDVIQETKKIK